MIMATQGRPCPMTLGAWHRTAGVGGCSTCFPGVNRYNVRLSDLAEGFGSYSLSGEQRGLRLPRAQDQG